MGLEERFEFGRAPVRRVVYRIVPVGGYQRGIRLDLRIRAMSTQCPPRAPHRLLPGSNIRVEALLWSENADEPGGPREKLKEHHHEHQAKV